MLPGLIVLTGFWEGCMVWGKGRCNMSKKKKQQEEAQEAPPMTPEAQEAQEAWEQVLDAYTLASSQGPSLPSQKVGGGYKRPLSNTRGSQEDLGTWRLRQVAFMTSTGWVCVGDQSPTSLVNKLLVSQGVLTPGRVRLGSSDPNLALMASTGAGHDLLEVWVPQGVARALLEALQALQATQKA